MLALLSLVLLLTSSLLAQPGKVIHTFQGGTNGQNPIGPLVADSAGNLFGVAINAPVTGAPLVFELSPSGSGWTYQVLYQFQTAYLVSQLLLDSSGNLYGTTFFGGANNLGSAFELTNNGHTWTATTLYSFGSYPADGIYPAGGLVFDSAGNLYGTTKQGSTFGLGSVFELSPNGSGGWVESLLYEFQGKPDGAYPVSAPTFDASGNLFGTTEAGGSTEENYCFLNDFSGCGTLYELTHRAGGWTETVVHNFGANEADGHWPTSPVIFDASGDLFGTTIAGGGGGDCDAGCGIAYGFAPGGGGWTEDVLATFNPRNALGAEPSTGLLFDARGNLYGATIGGGSKGWGTIYTLRRNGHKFTPKVLYNFTGGTDGGEPDGLAFDPAGMNLYGTAYYGGNATGNDGDGTIFVGHVVGN